MSGGHFIGFYVAILGLIALVVWASRPRKSAKPAARRWRFGALAFFLLVALALFGNGRRTISFRTVVGPSAGLPADVTQEDVDTALGIVTSKGFVPYAAALAEVRPAPGADRLARALVVRAGTTVDLKEWGIPVEPPPKLGESWLLVTYEDDQNAFFAALDGGEGVRRLQLAEELVRDVLPHVVLFVHARAAGLSDDERAAALSGAAMTIPHAAEWMLGELDEMAKGASSALSGVVERKRAYVQKYVEDPTLRGLAPGVTMMAPPRRTPASFAGSGDERVQ